MTEEGVNFESPYDGSKCMLTPERSIEIQQAIGADIMMQLDDVVDSTHPDADRQTSVDIMMQLDDVVDSTHPEVDRQTSVDIMMQLDDVVDSTHPEVDIMMQILHILMQTCRLQQML